MEPITDYWNHNVHCHRVILDAVPPGCRDAIDVGCGDGMLACALAARCAAVTGSPPGSGRAHFGGDPHDFAPGSPPSCMTIGLMLLVNLARLGMLRAA